MTDVREGVTSRKATNSMDLTAWIWLAVGGSVAVFTVIYVI